MKKILVIDDEKSTLSMCRLFFGAYGYQVFTAENAEIGLDIFNKEKPPIVMTDIKMPGPDGFSLLKRIKEIAPETEVIVITGHGDKELAEKAFELDASAFLSKPLNTEEIELALKRAEQKI
jgi:YesN/AraC family two-component response regulator